MIALVFANQKKFERIIIILFLFISSKFSYIYLYTYKFVLIVSSVPNTYTYSINKIKLVEFKNKIILGLF